MHPDDAARDLRGRGDAGDRDRGGVGGEDRLGPADAVEVPEYLLLEVEALEHGLDDDVAIGEILDPGRGRDALKRRIARLGLELVARDEPFEALLDRAHAAAERRFADVLQLHRIAGRREHLRDPGPHRARPHDPDRLHALDHCNALFSTTFEVYQKAVRNQ